MICARSVGLESALVAPKLARLLGTPLSADAKYGLDDMEMGEEIAEGVVLPFPFAFACERGSEMGMGRVIGMRVEPAVRVVKRVGCDSRR